MERRCSRDFFDEAILSYQYWICSREDHNLYFIFLQKHGNVFTLSPVGFHAKSMHGLDEFPREW